MIASKVRTLEAHEAALADPERVRPKACPRCRSGQLHVHDRRERVFTGEVDGPPGTQVLIFRCGRREQCGAVWRVLPHFLARHLWRRWTLVGVVVAEQGRHRVPARTRQRWWRRLGCSAAVLVTLLGQAAQPEWNEAAARAGVDATRAELVTACGGAGRLGALAAIVDHLGPGVRLM